MEDAGKYRVTAKNELGESNATISLNFDSEYFKKIYNWPRNKPKKIDINTDLNHEQNEQIGKYITFKNNEIYLINDDNWWNKN